MKIALFAYSFDPDPGSELPGVIDELKRLHAAFDAVSKQCMPVSVWQASPDQIKKEVSKPGDNIPIFHFSGHADSEYLQFNKNQDAAQNIFGSFLAEYIRINIPSLRLVFLNGCSTHDLAQAFLDNGVAAVIATNKKLRDDYGVKFAVGFYDEFIVNGKTLQKSFDSAIAGFKMNNGDILEADGTLKDAAFFGGVRRIGHAGEAADADDKILYSLHLNPNTLVADHVFADWLGDTNPQHRIAKTDPSKTVSMGKDEKGYLLCNRNTEVKKFRAICDKKLVGQLPEPQFFFFHELAVDKPQLLPARFQRFLLPELSLKNSFYEEWILPEPQDFGDNDPLSIDKFKIRFSEIFKERHGGTAAQTNRLAALKRRPLDEQLFVVHHPLDISKWMDFDDDEHDTQLQNQINQLLEWYIGEYALELQRDFSERFVAIITASYARPNSFFPTLFQTIAQKFPTRAQNFAELRDIRVEHVDDWQKTFLEDKNLELFTSTTLFDKIDKGKFELPLGLLIEPLQDQILKYNQRILNGNS